MDQIGILRFHYRSLRGSCLKFVGFEDGHAAILTQQCGVVVTTWTCIAGPLRVIFLDVVFFYGIHQFKCKFSWDFFRASSGMLGSVPIRPRPLSSKPVPINHSRSFPPFNVWVADGYKIIHTSQKRHCVQQARGTPKVAACQIRNATCHIGPQNAMSYFELCA